MDWREGETGGSRFQAPQGAQSLILWQLPEKTVLNGRKYDYCPDFRDILEIFSYWEDPDLPEFAKWQIALALFYKQKIDPRDMTAAMEYLAGFVTAFQPIQQSDARLMDWQQDAPLILADINKVAGREIRSLPFVHWWTFLSWFHGIGEGRLSTVVAIRDKLRRGKKLELWEQEFYRLHKDSILLPRRKSREENEEIARLQSLLSGEGREHNGNKRDDHTQS